MGLGELTLEQRVELLDQTYDRLRRSQNGEAIWLIGGPETDRLWDATISAFAHANWVATILCAQATCERTLAALVYSLSRSPSHPVVGSANDWGDLSPTAATETWLMRSC